MSGTTRFCRQVAHMPDAGQWSSARPLILTACDESYLLYATALIRSLDAFSPGQQVLLHLINPTDEALSKVESLAGSLLATRLFYSFERTVVQEAEAFRTYCACSRFLLLAELLEISPDGTQILTIDADALAVSPVVGDFSDKPEAEICLRRRDLQGRVEDHLRVAAGAVWVANTSRSRAFINAVASDLLDAFVSGQARWFADQEVIGRHVAAGTAGAQVRNLKGKYADWTMSEDAVFWMGKGDRKFVDTRYVLLREALCLDPGKAVTVEALVALARALPKNRRAFVIERVVAAAAMRRRGRLRAAVFLPRLDLPWKPDGMKGGAPELSEDTISLRLWWKRFTMALARNLTNSGMDVAIIEIPAWEITPERVDAEWADVAFIPHRCHLDFGPTRTPRFFYMQEYLRSVFVVDQAGWSAASTIYPVDPDALPPAVLGAWEHYRALFSSGGLESKFGQQQRLARSVLIAAGAIPAEPYVFFPLQIPNDQSIRYFSDISQDEALQRSIAAASALGLRVVLKAHPANTSSMRRYRESYQAPPVWWSDAHVHDLIEHAAAVITLNSGVGFEALLGGVPLVCFGRTEYDAAAWVATGQTIESVLQQALDEDAERRLTRYARFVDWFLARHAVDLARPRAAQHVLSKIINGVLQQLRAPAALEMA